MASDNNLTDSEDLGTLYMRAFPHYEDAISFEHYNSTAVSTFQICRICGCPVLASMTPTHVREMHFGRN